MFLPAKILTLSARIYSLLLYLYPTSFRRQFGRDMAQLFRDETRQTLRECGLIGLASLWLTIIVDLNKTVLAEHRWELLQRPRQQYVRLSGVAATIGGMVWLMPWFLPWANRGISATNQLLMSLVGMMLVVLGLAGLHLQLRASGSRLSAGAYGLSLLGFAVIISPVLFVLVTQPETTDAAFRIVIAGAICVVLGLVFMGVITLARKALGPLSFVPLALAIGYLVLVILIQLRQTVPSIRFLIPIFITLDMLCWLLLGAALLLRNQQMTKAPR